MKTLNAICYVLLICFALIIGGGYLWYGEQISIKDAEIARLQEHPLMTIEEAQRFLGVDDDGVVGPVTIAAWREYSFNYYAEPYFTPSGAPRGE